MTLALELLGAFVAGSAVTVVAGGVLARWAMRRMMRPRTP